MALRTRLFQRSSPIFLRAASPICSLKVSPLRNSMWENSMCGMRVPSMKKAVPKPVPSVITTSKPLPCDDGQALDVGVVGHAAGLADRLGERAGQVEVRPGLDQLGVGLGARARLRTRSAGRSARGRRGPCRGSRTRRGRPRGAWRPAWSASAPGRPTTSGTWWGPGPGRPRGSRPCRARRPSGRCRPRRWRS